MQKSDSKVGKIIGIFIALIIVLVLIFGSLGTVSAGEIGVKTRFGKVVSTLSNGLYFKIPFIDSVEKVDVQIQKEQTDASAASADLQVVNTKVAINYSIDQSKVGDLFTRIGIDYKSKIIDPAIQEVVKAVTAKYTASDLLTKRAEVTDLIKSQLADRLTVSDITVSSVSIVNFDFSLSFNNSIEAKVKAEQDALAARNKLDQIKYEAEQTVTTAQAQAEAIKIQTQAINSQGGQNYVQLQQIKVQSDAVAKWNGVLPTQMIPGSAVPFININK